ncbi:hypothetical protein HMPREF9713_01832 [Myroides odoratimimus CCUG 12700]|uniref:GLPGLI family protein n=1 Tax=Myroides odoratimimus TaxID=76832 RepID=UPI0003549634|nr:GLPGLI family protein [Myroides odoratimimus]EPH11346.1 hypothetical protein HMPREF9713_01832 [Myroides odoratimimus CCUG 12700]MCO7723382.1 GLPGLI family protein [Myroides odoratimimus]
MKKLLVISIVAFITSISGLAQEKIEVMRYEYQMTMPLAKTTDDINTSNSATEIVYLDVQNSESRFASEGNIKREETLIEYTTGAKKTADHTARFQALGQFRSKVNWIIYKDQANLNTYENSGIETYNVEEPSNLIKWNISGDIEDYNGMKVQKAVGELSGRTWTVWFTQDIPLIDGPYKFKNLPGFVVKAEDSTGDYKFEFLKSEKVTAEFWLMDRHKNAMKVNKKQWDKIRNVNANKSFSQMMSEIGAGTIVKVVDEKGNEITNDKLKKKTGKEAKPIEFY